jgi:hypothetical protein
MPIVEHPGPDHGSPLCAKVTLSIENFMSEARKLAFEAAAIDAQGSSTPMTFSDLPKYDLLPPAIIKDFSNLDE